MICTVNITLICHVVKGLAEVTEKQARGQPQLQNALFGSAVATTTGSAKQRRRKRSKKSGKESTGEMSSESDEENGIPSKRHMETGMRTASSQRLTQHRMPLEKESIPIPDQQQVESSRILEQSMATAEVLISCLLCLFLLTRKSGGGEYREWTGTDSKPGRRSNTGRRSNEPHSVR